MIKDPDIVVWVPKISITTASTKQYDCGRTRKPQQLAKALLRHFTALPPFASVAVIMLVACNLIAPERRDNLSFIKHNHPCVFHRRTQCDQFHPRRWRQKMMDVASLGQPPTKKLSQLASRLNVYPFGRVVLPAGGPDWYESTGPQ